MKPDLEQLIAGAPTEFEQRLLDAARGERPSPELSARMARGLGLPISAVGFAELGAGKGSLLSSKVGFMVRSVMGVGLVGVSLFGATLLARKWWDTRPTGSTELAPVVQATPSLPVASAAEAPAVVATGSTEVSHEAPKPAPAAVASSARTSTSSLPERGDLREEIRLIDAARSAVATGSYDQALTLLRRYSSTYPSGMFGQEASVLRMESLDRSGQRVRARALAREFLGRHANSPLAERAERVAAH